MSEKRQISITLTELDDVRQVLQNLSYVFKEIMAYYATNLDNDKLDTFILTFASYLGVIMRMRGYDEGYFEEFGE